MKSLNIEYVKSFVEYGSISSIEQKSFFTFIGGTAFLGLLPFAYSLIQGIAFIDLCLSSVISVVVFSIAAIISIKKKKTNKALCLGIISLEGMINSTIMALVLLRMYAQSLWISIIIILLPIFTSLVFVLVTIHFVKNGTYKNAKKAKASRIRYISMLFGIFGMFIARALFSEMAQNTAIEIALLGSMAISVFFSIGCSNLLKAFYVYAYKI